MIQLNQPPPTPVKASAIYRRDRKEYTIKLVPGKARPLEVWEGKKLITEGLRQEYRPWKLVIADVDGDGIPEILIGVYRKSPYTPAWAQSIFVMTFDGKELIRKWMGSSMGRPLFDFTVAPEKTQRLLTVQLREDGKQALSSWDWSGFGFRRREREIAARAIELDGWIGTTLNVRIDGKLTKLPLGKLP